MPANAMPEVPNTNSITDMNSRMIVAPRVCCASGFARMIGRSGSSAAIRARAWSTSTLSGAAPRVWSVMLERYA
jgi:hypothetical protein